jgi:hypothetical protein
MSLKVAGVTSPSPSLHYVLAMGWCDVVVGGIFATGSLAMSGFLGFLFLRQLSLESELDVALSVVENQE